MIEKTAVVLFNLGGPSSKADIRPFLYTFFMDKNIIAAPLPLRWMIAVWTSLKRGLGAAEKAYRHLGYKSPLLGNTRAQAQALQEKLGDGYKVFVSMRYSKPCAKDVVAQVKAYAPGRVVLLPLYPQHSTTTTHSSFEQFLSLYGQDGKIERICCYPTNEGFVKASADNIVQEVLKAPRNTRVLFSAHGLPEKIVAGGDPYQWQCEASAAAIAKEAGLGDWHICYQSRVGPLTWIGPSTEEALKKAATDGVGVIVYPHAFVSEHVETLVEIEIEYREKAKRLGIPYFARAQTVGTHPGFIAGLADLVTGPGACAKICPGNLTRCGWKE